MTQNVDLYSQTPSIDQAAIAQAFLDVFNYHVNNGQAGSQIITVQSLYDVLNEMASISNPPLPTQPA
jgi:hypothetical protein